MPVFVQNPIPIADLDPCWLLGWDHAKKAIGEAIRQEHSGTASSLNQKHKDTHAESVEDDKMNEDSCYEESNCSSLQN